MNNCYVDLCISYNVWIVSWLVSCINVKHFYTIDILRNINWANLICRNNSFLTLIPSIRGVIQKTNEKVRKKKYTHTKKKRKNE